MDLDTLTCVSECSIDHQIVVIPSQYTSTGSQLELCRSNKIYVDSTSVEILELGTLKYPFKSMYEPFVELFNIQGGVFEEVEILI